MKLTKLRLAFLGFFSLISIVYFADIIKLFIDTNHIDASPEASIEQYLRSNTNEYKIINVTLREEKLKFRERMYILECDCKFKKEENKGTQKYHVYLLEDIGWVVTKIEIVKSV